MFKSKKLKGHYKLCNLYTKIYLFIFKKKIIISTKDFNRELIYLIYDLDFKLFNYNKL